MHHDIAKCVIGWFQLDGVAIDGPIGPVLDAMPYSVGNVPARTEPDLPLHRWQTCM